MLQKQTNIRTLQHMFVPYSVHVHMVYVRMCIWYKPGIWYRTITVISVTKVVKIEWLGI